VFGSCKFTVVQKLEDCWLWAKKGAIIYPSRNIAKWWPISKVLSSSILSSKSLIVIIKDKLHFKPVTTLPPPPQPFYGHFLGPPGWSSPRRKLLLDFMVLGRIIRGRHINNLGGRQSIFTPDTLPAATLPIYHGLGQAQEYAGFHTPCLGCRYTTLRNI